MSKKIPLSPAFLTGFLCTWILFEILPSTTAQESKHPTLPGTQPLTMEGDIASTLVEGVDRFLLHKIEASIAARSKHWTRDFSSMDAYKKSILDNRERLKSILGLVDDRIPFAHPKYDLDITESSPVYMKTEAFDAYKIQWPVLGDVMAEGLLLVPNLLTFRATEIPAEPEFTGAYKERAPFDAYYAAAHVIALPDADQTPEQVAGLAPGIAPESQFARRLAESGCRVIIPDLISRKMTRRQSDYGGWGSELTHREYLYRSAFEMGRHIVGYEIQSVLSLVDWIESHQGPERRSVGVMGYGEGGMIALYAGAVDTRIDTTCVSGYFGPRERIWEQPISRNVFGLLEQFGDAELATLITPRALIIEAAPGPVVELPGKGGAPATLSGPDPGAVYGEIERARQILSEYSGEIPIRLILGSGLPFGSEPALESFLDKLRLGLRPGESKPISPPLPDAAAYEARQQRLTQAWDQYTQKKLIESSYTRKAFMKSLDTSSLDAFEESAESYRTYYRDEVIGHFNDPMLPMNPRTRQTYQGENWTGYEVVLDVFEDVIAYGILCVPNDLTEGEKRPVIVCQHGLEGRPQDIIQGDHNAYHDFASKLADRGFITFSPQNLYIFQDRFRTLQRKANPLKKTLFSIITPQHQQTVNWLKSLPNVDKDRIAFYGLSYGGKTAMRVPALVTDYCLSICSADFNDWVWKNASTLTPYSYVWSGEYEIFEFNLGST
ncbi:dienelactone hydrolase family protein, partial [bacterium]|nr:dienelactone hydrolase family protein [bacterium]